jgi:hypothetical protein
METIPPSGTIHPPDLFADASRQQIPKYDSADSLAGTRLLFLQ